MSCKTSCYANVTVGTSTALFPLQAPPSIKNSDDTLHSIFKSLKLPHENPSHFLIIRCVRIAHLHKAKAVYEITIRAAKPSYQNAAGALAFRITSYTTKL